RGPDDHVATDVAGADDVDRAAPAKDRENGADFVEVAGRPWNRERDRMCAGAADRDFAEHRRAGKTGVARLMDPTHIGRAGAILDYVARAGGLRVEDEEVFCGGR